MCFNVDNSSEWYEMDVDITGQTQGSINVEPTGACKLLRFRLNKYPSTVYTSEMPV